MERIPNLQVIGQASEESKEGSKKFLSRRLFEHLDSLPDKDIEVMKKEELVKTPEILNFISFANTETNRLRQQFGVEGYDIPVDNYHFLSKKTCQRLNVKSAAAAYGMRQGIIIQNDKFADSKLSLAATIFHETMHLKAFMALQNDGDAKDFSFFRSGVTACSRDGSKISSHVHFDGLNEAIVAEQENKTAGKIMLLPEFDEDRNFLEVGFVKQQINDFKKRKKLDSDAVVWFNFDQQKIEVLSSYDEHRKLLRYVCQEIQKELPDEYATPDQVFTEFLRAHFTGSLLTVGKLVEKAFGPDSFRALSNMSRDSETVGLYFEDLSRRRQKQLATIDHK